MHFLNRFKPSETQTSSEAAALIVGLGNPGREYANNRHNVGFMIADRWAATHTIAFNKIQHHAIIAQGRTGDRRIIIAKPQTFMNHSGEAVGPALKCWKLERADLVVVHDDLELDPLRVQLKVGGGHGGHNGLRSVNAHVGSPDYARLRVGVGRPPAGVDPADYERFRQGVTSLRRRRDPDLRPRDELAAVLQLLVGILDDPELVRIPVELLG